ncbi:hypothetical protein [Streptomyces griseus]|uniref:hypothetical protein n=1 Tax=Streptomyces griseus TaxID=1911 RepID=UPI000A3CD665|nr:hypothetical protein [Streptomyces fimicarius]
MPVEPLPCDNGGGGTPGPSCCAPSITSVALCQEDGTPLLLVLRSDCACDGAQPGAPEVAGWIDPATGAFTAGPAPAGAGPCPSSSCASVTVLRLCDSTDDGECVPFLRHLVHDCDGQVTASTDTGTDGTTPYAVVGQSIDCDDCPCVDGTKVVPLCDYQLDGSSVPFLRHLTYDCTTGVVTEQTDTETDGTTPYAPTGDVGECGECRPAPMCPQLLGLSGPETWDMPEGTESLAITVACGPVTVTDCAGNTTVINECGSAFSWAAPSTGACEPAALCSPFTVDVPEGAAVYINFVSPCGMGDVS